MRCLVFQLGEGRFALPLSELVEILPLLPIRTLARAPASVAGVINYRGQIVPVLDLCQLALDRPCAVRTSTRLLVLHWRLPEGQGRLLALMVERATSEQFIDPQALTPSPLHVETTPYLAGLTMTASGSVQLVETSRLLPPAIADLLYPEAQALP